MNTVIIDTAKIHIPDRTDSWEGNRRDFYNAEGLYKHEVSIVIPAFNRLEDKTKICVESVLKYTKGIDYELILVDDCSSDDTLEYFKSIPYEPKTIIHMTKNMGQAFGLYISRLHSSGKFRVFCANDCIVTTNWLSNLLTCIKSDPRIGMVVPGCSHVSNGQELSIGEFDNWDDMQRLAAEHNVSNPVLWEERPRLVNPVALYRTEIFDSIGFIDPGFSLNFIEDNIARGIHRAGYKLILCNDTYIEHNHPQTERVSESYKTNLDEGRRCFVEKYRGIDPWDDVNNYIYPYISEMDLSGRESLSVLGVNIKCGTPFIDVRNRARKAGIECIELSAYTTELKYYPDLVAYPADVKSGTVSDIDRYFDKDSFDIVVTTEEIDSEEELIKLLDLTKKDGFLVFPVKNSTDILYYIDQMLDQEDTESATKLEYEEVLGVLERCGCESARISDECYQERLRDSIISGVGDAIFGYIDRVGGNTDSVFVERYWFLVKK